MSNTKNKQPATPIQVEQLDTRRINEDPNQPRKVFDQTFIDELAADISIRGILQPILVREDPDHNIISPKELANKKCYKIICGENRFKAAIKAGLTEVPCIINNMSDAEAFECQIAENLQRKNINPIEESNAFTALISKKISTAEMIADRFGVSTKYVYDRLTLQRVIPVVQEAVIAGRLSITHAKQFAKIPASDQEKLWEYVNDDEAILLSDLKGRIEVMFKNVLAKAPFDIQSKSLLKKAGACINCNKRSGCALVLFDDVEQDDICFDEKCWDEKVVAHCNKVVDDFKAKGYEVKLISSSYMSKNTALVSSKDYDEADVDTGIVGVYFEVNMYNDKKPGDFIYLIPEEGQDQEDDEQSDTSHNNPSKPQKEKSINYEQVFIDKLVDGVTDFFINNQFKFPFDELQILKKEIIGIWRSIDSDFQKVIADKLPIILYNNETEVTDDIYDASDRITMIKFLETKSIPEHQMFLSYLNIIEMIESNNYNLDKETFSEINQSIAFTNIDLFQLADSLNAPTPIFEEE